MSLRKNIHTIKISMISIIQDHQNEILPVQGGGLYLGPCQTSDETFCENSLRLLVVK